MIVRHRLLFLLAAILMPAHLAAVDATAGWPPARRARVVVVQPTVVTARVAPARPPRMLGTFYPDASINIRGNFEAGGGYSPLGTFGDTSATLYGPLSSFRTATAPVQTYERGYDGSFRPGVGTGFSTPNFPAASSLVYPNRSSVVNGSQRRTTPPQWDSAINWVDLN